MSLPKHPGHGGDDRAADRDDAADRRDEITRARDDDAEQRDIEADQRDENARTTADHLADNIHKISLQILDRLRRLESNTLDQADWPDLTPAALARLDACTAEQRRLAGLDRAAVYALLDDLHDAVGDLAGSRRAAPAEPRSASTPSATGTTPAATAATAARTAADARADRHQAAIDRDVDPRDLPPRRQPVERTPRL